MVYTRPWVAELILDLCGYDPDENLVDAVALEPSCGTGALLEPMVRRLSESCRRRERPLSDCAGSIRAYELDVGAAEASRKRVRSVLVDDGWAAEEAENLARGWVLREDFLLERSPYLSGLGDGVDFVVGNPPYVRLEHIDAGVAETYRNLHRTMSGRADLYVGFFEKALNMLCRGGVCGFICADRWMLNQYGSKLRKLVTGGFGVEAVLEMHTADAFYDEVLAYPAVTVIRRAEQGRALVARLEGRSTLSSVAYVREAVRAVRAGARIEPTAPKGTRAVVVDEWFEGSDPWPCVSPERLKLLKRLEAEFYPLEDHATGTKVGIGVATGAYKAYITKDADLVEGDRLLPMAMAKDTFSGTLEWSGHYLVNPWEADGTLVDLGRYPRLRRYFEENEITLRGRNVGKKNPERWFKTIDKVHHRITTTPKLLIPDKGRRPPGPRRGLLLPAPQPLLRHLRGLGPAGPRRSPLVQARPVFCRVLRGSHGWGLFEVPGPVPQAHPGPSPRGRWPRAGPGALRGLRRAECGGRDRGGPEYLRPREDSGLERARCTPRDLGKQSRTFGRSERRRA